MTKYKQALTAPCGLDCFNCELYEDNLTADFAEFINNKTGVAKEMIPCKGCREQDGKHYHLPTDGCATLTCVKERGLQFCFECTGFPCSLLAPLADKAGQFPHNMKLYNLCRIRKVGLDNWAENEAEEIRKKYFTGEFAVGRGQSDQV